MNERIVAAIPNYNMGVYAVNLGRLLLAQDYDHVYVLDDCSTDNSLGLLAQIEDDRFTYSEGISNQGAGPTRNRILDFEQEGIVHFFDADVEPTQDNTPKQVLAAFERHPDAGAIGFRVLNPDDSQYEYNFGNLMADRKTFLANTLWQKHANMEEGVRKKIVGKLFGERMTHGWTYTRMQDAENEHQENAVVECNMAVRIKDFKAAGGFSPTLRFHEIHHLALNLRNLGRSIWYVPEAIVVKYDHGDVRKDRKQEMRQSARKIVRDKLMGRYR